MIERSRWFKIGFWVWFALTIALFIIPSQTAWHRWVSGLLFAALGFFLMAQSKIVSSALLKSQEAFWKEMGMQRATQFVPPVLARGFLVVIGLIFFLVGLLSFLGLVTIRG